MRHQARKFVYCVCFRQQISCAIASRTALHCTALHCTALHCTALHCTALHCTALHCTALHCTALHCTALHCTALHYTVLYCTTLYCTALQCDSCATVVYSSRVAGLLMSFVFIFLAKNSFSHRLITCGLHYASQVKMFFLSFHGEPRFDFAS